MAGTEDRARPRKRSPKAVSIPSTTDPVEIAMRLVRGSTSESPAHDLLVSSNRLAQSDLALRHIQIRNERMSFTLKLLTILVGVSVALAIGAMVLSAQRASGLVIEAFSVPPEYARLGITGEVVASQLLDRLATLNARTDSIRAPNTYSNDWSGDIKVEIPQTGVSIGELNRALRASLGNETRITGELFRNQDKLVMTARAGVKPGTSASGADADFNALLDRTAEGLFRATQPYRFATQLRVQGRLEEARAIYWELAEGTDPIERPWGYIGLGALASIDSTDEEGRKLTLPATTLDPANALAFANVAGDLGCGNRRSKISKPPLVYSVAGATAESAPITSTNGGFRPLPPINGLAETVWALRKPMGGLASRLVRSIVAACSMPEPFLMCISQATPSECCEPCLHPRRRLPRPNGST